MKALKKKMLGGAGLLALAMTLLPMTVFAEADGAAYTPSMYATFWALIPPVVAIVLALITKEVYSSLFLGILVGGLFYSGFSLEGTLLHIYNEGFVASLSSTGNVGILIFLVLLGTLVALMNKTGASAAFGQWAKKRIKSRVGAQFATMVLGVLIFVDDYFNCLTVGSVMRPVTDEHKVSRAKLAYLIDATAAPVCILAPISSWAAAVVGVVEGEDGFTLFLRSIPYNFYALLTIVMMIVIIVLNIDFGPMRKHELNALKGDLFSESDKEKKVVQEEMVITGKGKVIDLILPIIVLIVSCVISLLYTGGFFEGESLFDAFTNCSASAGLAMGSIVAIILILAIYLVRRVLTFKECMECFPEGFKAMVPAMLILTFAWTLNNMTSSLGAAEFVAEIVQGSAEGFMSFLPAIIFLIGCGLSFATGTSWGTFGILIPIVVNVFQNSDPTLMIISISACMAGAVCGDHCSPISDTTIMASAGAQCNHVSHVSTQLPYAVLVAVVSFVTYIIAGFVKSAWVCLPIGIILMIGTLAVIKILTKKDQA